MSFGTKLKEYRKRSGIIQAELARRLGVSRDYVCGLENGKYINPSSNTLAHIADELHLSPEEVTMLLEEVKKNKPGERGAHRILPGVK